MSTAANGQRKPQTTQDRQQRPSQCIESFPNSCAKAAKEALDAKLDAKANLKGLQQSIAKMSKRSTSNFFELISRDTLLKPFQISLCVEFCINHTLPAP